jgi:hypothetical protein
VKSSIFGYSVFAMAALIVTACAQNPNVATTAAATSLTPAPTLVVSNSSPPIGATITLSGSGGTPPYTYFVSSGDGTVNATNNTYTAPATVEQVTLGIKDSAGYYGYLGINVVASSTGSAVLTISPLNPQIAPGGTINYTVAGGTPPYTYTVGGGTVNGTVGDETYTASPAQGTATFTASATQGQVQLTIADSANNSQIVTIAVVGNYNTTPFSQTFQVLVDPYLGFSFDGTNSAQAPYLGFFDMGSGLNNSSVAAGDSTCLSGGTVGSPCYYPVSLTNFTSSVGPGVSYRGTISAVGTTATVDIAYCIPPVHNQYAFIQATQGSYLGGAITFNVAGKALFEQLATTSVFLYLDSSSPAPATITVTGAYDGTHVDCSDYNDTQYVNVGM